eukprot:symbB.v1.2.009205.t1/scaffold580.1/size320225/7
MINPPTNSTFADAVDYHKLPLAQSYLPLVLLPVLLVYNFLWAALQSPRRLVLVVCSIYALLYAIIAVESLQHQHIDRRWAWTLYYVSNTKSVLFPVMLWSTMNDVSSTQFSKIAYPVLVSSAQLGGLAGSLVATAVKHVGHTAGLMVIQASALLIVAGCVWLACLWAERAPVNEEANGSAREALTSTSLQPVAGVTEEAVRQGEGSSFAAPQSNACILGFRAMGQKLWETVEGITLILSRPYVAGIFWVACAHLLPRGILDYQGTSLTNERWPTKDEHGIPIPGNKDKQTAFFAWCFVANSIGTMLLSLLGLRSLVERGGLLLTLLILPAAMLLSVLLVCFHHDFWTVQAVLVVVNVVQFALNGPSREMLYVRTSKNIKYKAKSWSDMYGNFLQKTLAAQINYHVNRFEFNAIFTGPFVTAWTVVWALVAGGMGMKHARLVKENEFVS